MVMANQFVENNGREQRSGSGDFIAGFLVGGAIFGSLAYKYAPQIRRTLRNENEHGFQKARKPVYFDDEPEIPRILNEKIGQLNSVIDKVTSRLRGKKIPRRKINSQPKKATL